MNDLESWIGIFYVCIEKSYMDRQNICIASYYSKNCDIWMH